MTITFKVAGAQMDCSPANVNENLKKITMYIEEAASKGAQIICFPELATTGYNPAFIGERFYSTADNIPGDCTKRIGEAAKKYKIYVIVGIAEKSRIPGLLYNSQVCISPDGEIVSLYRKIHLWYLEKIYFKASITCEYSTFNLPWTKAGMMICYDTAFPETARILALLGANIVFDSAAWCFKDADTWDLNTRARAQENHIFMVCVNRCGQEGELILHGESRVIGPRGNILVAAGSGEELIYANIDLEQAMKERVKLPYMKDRRPEAYALLSKIGEY